MYLLFTTCLHHASSFYASSSISIFKFHAIRSSYLCPSLCSSTLSGHPSSIFFQPSDPRCMRHEPQIAKLETTLRTSIGQPFMKVCFLVTVHGRLCASCPFSTKHGRLSVSCPFVLGGVKLDNSAHGLTEALGVAAHLLEYLILYDDGDAGTNQRNSTRRPVVRYCYACSVSRPWVLPSFQWLLLFCWFASWCWLVKIACVGCCKG